ncbi:unnamed protein product, partial [Prorocentrum cordatum]
VAQVVRVKGAEQGALARLGPSLEKQCLAADRQDLAPMEGASAMLVLFFGLAGKRGDLDAFARRLGWAAEMRDIVDDASAYDLSDKWIFEGGPEGKGEVRMGALLAARAAKVAKGGVRDDAGSVRDLDGGIACAAQLRETKLDAKQIRRRGGAASLVGLRRAARVVAELPGRAKLGGILAPLFGAGFDRKPQLVQLILHMPSGACSSCIRGRLMQRWAAVAGDPGACVREWPRGGVGAGMALDPLGAGAVFLQILPEQRRGAPSAVDFADGVGPPDLGPEPLEQIRSFLEEAWLVEAMRERLCEWFGKEHAISKFAVIEQGEQGR